jgi:polyhydroxybutyrate depolymerase
MYSVRFLCIALSTLSLSCEQRPAAVPPAASVGPSAPKSGQAPAAPSGASAERAELVPSRLHAVVHPPTQLAAGQKAPLLLMLHSIGTSAEDIELRTDWPRFAAEQGVAWMAPNGPTDSRGRRFWDAGDSCCNFTGQPVNHVAALAELLERTLREHAELDAERVYIGGISNGGFMAHRFACENPELIRGVVSISGAGPLERVQCRTPKYLRVLEVHGESDPIVSYRGGHFLGMPLLPEHASTARTIEDWAARLRCRGDAVPGEPLDFEERYPGKETRTSRYASCELGALELWTVGGGDHYLGFREPSPRAVWRFLSQ